MKNNVENVLGIFFDKPTEKFYIREIARTTCLSPNTVLNITNSLVKKGLLKRDKKKHVVELSAVFNEKFKELKRIYNLDKIYCSGLVEFLSESFDTEAISVIGSYSRGEDIGGSDVDIVLINAKYSSIDISKFEKKLGRTIHLIFAGYDKMSSEFYTNLINGVVLKGAIRKK